MTREEQIDEFANSQVDCEFFNEDLHKGIIIGAKWADDTRLDKACKWLKENLSEGSDPDNYPMVRCYDITLEDFIEEFRREMKE